MGTVTPTPDRRDASEIDTTHATTSIDEQRAGGRTSIRLSYVAVVAGFLSPIVAVLIDKLL